MELGWTWSVKRKLQDGAFLAILTWDRFGAFCCLVPPLHVRSWVFSVQGSLGPSKTQDKAKAMTHYQGLLLARTQESRHPSCKIHAAGQRRDQLDLQHPAARPSQEPFTASHHPIIISSSSYIVHRERRLLCACLDAEGEPITNSRLARARFSPALFECVQKEYIPPAGSRPEVNS